MVKSPRIIILVQSRLCSNRLPAKALLPIRGIPMVILAAKRLMNSPYEVVIVTSKNKSDDLIVNEANYYKIKCYRGSLNDVLKRFCNCLIDFDDEDICIRVTADNLLPDGDFICKLVEKGLKYNLKYLSSSNLYDLPLPYGLSAELISVGLLREASRATIDKFDREHVTPWIKKKYEKDIIEKKNNFDQSNYLRCTVDTLEDYIKITDLFSKTNNPILVPWQNLVELLKSMENNKDETKFFK